MFRPLTMVIFSLRLKNLVSSYTRFMWAVYSGEVRGGVGTRSRMCFVGWVVWVHGLLLLYVMSEPEDGHCQGPKRVVDLYIVNFIYIYIYICTIK